MEEENKQGIREILEDIKKKQEDILGAKETKKWKLPWSARVSNKQASKNWATFCIIHENNNVEFTKVRIEDGTARIDKMPRIATSDCCLNHKGKPFFIINSASLKPYSPKDDLKTAEELKLGAIAGRRLILSKFETEQIAKKGAGFGGMGWILLIVGVAIAGYYLFKGGNIF
jgi:hypothetical protein